MNLLGSKHFVKPSPRGALVARLYNFVHRSDRALVRLFKELQLLGVSFVNGGDSLRIVDTSHEFHWASNASEQSIKKDQCW